jgi:succinate dehydrogenase iron-sulfur subunit
VKITFKIQRFNPEHDAKPYFKDYSVETHSNAAVLDCLNDIRWHQDEELSFRRSCGHAICGSCAMNINGKNGLACQTLIKDLKSGTVTVKPLPSFPVIKDLVVDLDAFYEKFNKIKPYLINDEPVPEKERLQSPEQQKIIEESTTCILCASCTSSCPSFWADDNYLGPAALVKAFRYVFDTRDTGAEERLKVVNDKNGVFRCHTIFNCNEACPKDINITNHIAQLKVALVTTKL